MDATMFKFISWEIRDHVAHVTMSRPPVNAFNQEMYREVETVFSDPTVLGPDARVVVLRSAQRHFCAGNDLADFGELSYENSPAILKTVRQTFFAISDSDRPVIAQVHGAALGTGLAIAASCDLVVAADDARFGLPEVTVGVMGGARHLARLVPQPMVRWMFLSGEPVPASELLRVGGILRIAPPETLADVAHEVASMIARHSPIALRYGKRALNAIEDLGLKAGYEFEQSMTREMTRFNDSKEALQATLARRPPTYTGT